MIAIAYKRCRGDDPAADVLQKRLKRLGEHSLQALRMERVLRVEGVNQTGLVPLLAFFAHPVLDQVRGHTLLNPADGPIREVAYRRAMTDPELDALLHAAKALGVGGVVWARWATRYQFVGLDDEAADRIVTRYLMNGQTQEVLPKGFTYDTLVPQGDVGGVEMIDVAGMTDDELADLSKKRRLMMPPVQLKAVREYFAQLRRSARDGEIEVVAARWGDHCNHTTWKALGLMQRLQEATARIAHELVLSAFSGNAGVMRFYEGLAACLKGETHISPTFVGDPYGGIMTKIGGVIRDIIFNWLGAYPILATTIMATCNPRIRWDMVPAGAIHPLVVVLEAIRGVADYSNPMGIPMAWSEYRIHPRNWKGVALGHCVGIMPESAAVEAHPEPGDFVLLIGGLTGNDGLHGATVSSAAATTETLTADAAHVQIGMPIEEQMFMQAVPKLRDEGCIRVSTDCGAAGLSSACFELGELIGVWLNLAWVPLKCRAMRAWQILLSESQERGVLAVPPDKLPRALEILAEYGVRATVIGVFTETKRAQAVYDSVLDLATWLARPTAPLSGDVVVDLPYEFLDSCPLPEIPVKAPVVSARPFVPKTPTDEVQWQELVTEHLGHYDLSDQSVAGHQFDRTVQGRTKLSQLERQQRGARWENVPEELYVSQPVHGGPYGLGAAVAFNQRYSEIDPAGLGRLVLAQAGTRLVAAGFSPDDIVLNANVMSPPAVDTPENAWRLVELVKHGYAPASELMGWPVISGKDSSSCRLGECDAPLGVAVMALGRMPDVKRLIPKVGAKPGDALVLVHPGLTHSALGGSVFLDRFGETGDRLPELDLAALRQGLMTYHQMLNALGWSAGVHARSVVAEGGLVRRLFEMSYGSGYGCRVALNGDPMTGLFAELNAAILMAVDPAAPWQEHLGDTAHTVLGVVTKDPAIEVEWQQQRLFRATPDELARQWSRTFTEVAA